MQSLGTSDYMGAQAWESMMSKNNPPDDPEESYPFPLVLRKKSGPSSVSGMTSGQTTPGTSGKSAGRAKTLSEGDLMRADEALEQRESLLLPRLSSSELTPSRHGSEWKWSMISRCCKIFGVLVALAST